MTPWAPWSLVLTAYLLGSVSFASLIAGSQGVDIRAEGSGNPGATNVRRILGPGLGRTVLLLDALKGFVPTLVVREWFDDSSLFASLTGLAATIGHVAPLWHGFRGGKGVATAAGALLALVPVAGGAAALSYLLLRKVTKLASVASLGAATVGATVTLGIEGPQTWPMFMAATTLGILIVRHIPNLVRITKGEEPRT